MVKKKVRFNYFEICLLSAPQVAGIELDKGEEHISYNMKPFLDYILTNDHNNAVELGLDFSELEKDSLSYDEKRDLYHFELSKCRSINVPTRKKLGAIKEEIHLQDDEYIGEFNSIIFDPKYNLLITQSNFHGLTTKQIEEVLTDLRFAWKDIIDDNDTEPLQVILKPIFDKNKINSVKNADYYKKIRVKGSDYRKDAHLYQNEKSPLSEIIDLTNEFEGVNFDITISLGRSSKLDSLSNDSVKKTIDSVLDAKSDRLGIEVTSKFDEDSDTELINLIEPRQTDLITMEIVPRQSIAHEFLYNKFVEDIYDKKRTEIGLQMLPIE
ncbi:hypothetical protein G6H54_000773 [Listeria monocytogenes]|nr:hypothetical protein [Listeria monocytogenes]EEO9088085.1 hypothetical protein [Listeria monocytogenes]